MRALEELEAALAKAKSTTGKQLIIQYDAWTALVRIPVALFSSTTGLSRYSTASVGRKAVEAKFGGERLRRLKEVFDVVMANPIARALLKAWLGI